jgi:methylenetetrahydrofolate dehydrogenase (NADP+)/methenyltetrahydrofolate cyclohydrolase
LRSQAQASRPPNEGFVGFINELADPRVQGILLQHPVPSPIDERRCFDQIALAKDIDGVTALGFGRMQGEPAHGSATPAGIMRLLRHYKTVIEGKQAVDVGRSPIVGKPIAMMMLSPNATVTICHSRRVA